MSSMSQLWTGVSVIKEMVMVYWESTLKLFDNNDVSDNMKWRDNTLAWMLGLSISSMCQVDDILINFSLSCWHANRVPYNWLCVDMATSGYGNTFCITGPLCGESTTYLRSPTQSASGPLMILLLLAWTTQIAKFMGPTWGPPGSCRPQMGPMFAPWTLLSGFMIASLQLIR